MADTTPTTTSPAVPAVPEGRVRNLLIVGSVALFAAIVFGLLYLFVIAPAIPAGGEGWSVGWFLFSFATGLTMIVLPCTLPLAFVIVPLSMGKGLLKGISMALAFGIGVATTLSLYGVAAAIVGGLAIDTLGAPLETVKNWVYFIAGIFALIFALSEIGLLKFHMPTYKGAAPAFIQKRQDTLKAFLLGLFLGNIGVGCPHPATPLLLIEVASSGDILYGWLMFLVHALGRVLPLLLLAFLAILGVNGLNWLMARKDAVERATGWAMVFVAGFILTLGLFSHDWWVNSGLHTGLEKLTQEHRFNVLLNDTLGTAVAHVHGFEVGGEGLFGLPLTLGSWFLVLVWLIPIWWWWLRKRKHLLNSPAFRLQALEHKIDLLEQDRRQVEALIGLDDKETAFDLAQHQQQMDALEKERRMAEELVQFGESSVLKDPTARAYELRLLKIQRNYLAVVSVFLVLTFTYFIPENFYLASLTQTDHHAADASHDHGAMMDGATGTMAGMMGGTLFSKDIVNLPAAVPSVPVALNDGDSYNITASYVKKEVGNRVLRMLAYNGSIPGPMLVVPEGAEITINFTNNTDLDQTIHSHGIRIDNNFDGVPGLTQDAVPPGGTFSYKVRFKDAGLYWYHPHTRDDYGQEMGLYGNYLVDPTDPAYWAPVNKEVPLVIDDILIDNNQIADFYREFTTHALLGRFGNEYLVNGQTNYGLSVRQGEVVRFFVTNVSNARTYKLSIPGAQMKVVGSDVGKFEREFFADDFLISPAERMVIEAYFPRSGVYTLTHTMPDNQVQLATFFVDGEETVETSYVDQFLTTRTNLDEVKEFADLRTYVDAVPEKRIRLSVDMGGMAVDHSGHAHQSADTTAAHDHGAMMGQAVTDSSGIQWNDTTGDMMNTSQHIRWRMIDEETGKENMDVHWTFKQGSMVKMRIYNDPTAMHVMQHPIHFHGQRFVVLARDGVANTNMVWKDTELVLPGETMDILVDMSELGEWMAHCHISEHLHAGMMVGFRVEDQNGYATGDEYRAARGVTPGTETSAQAGGTPNATSTKFSFTSVLPENNYTAVPTRKFYPSERLQEVAFSITDRSGTYIDLSREVSRPLTVTFVKSDDSVAIETYPGSTAFDNYRPPQPAQAPAAPMMPNMPASDGHNHIHMNFLNVAYADAGHDANMPHMSTPMSSYSVPVVFPSRGVYRAFVEFVPLGGAEVRTVSFNVEVGTSGFSLDNFGWSPKAKWWILLIVSILIMTPLSYAVYRYLKSAEQAAVVKK